MIVDSGVERTPLTDDLTIVLEKAVAAEKLAQHIRSYGHLAAKIYPLEDNQPDIVLIQLATYQLGEEDLKRLPASIMWPHDTGFSIFSRARQRGA